MKTHIAPRVSAAIAHLKRKGVAIDEDTVNRALEETRKARRETAGSTPLAHTMLAFAQPAWLEALGDDILRARLGELLRRLAERKSQPWRDSPTAGEHACLAIRRFLAMCYEEDADATPEELYEIAGAAKTLPTPGALPGGRHVFLDRATIDTWYRDITAVIGCRPLRCDMAMTGHPHSSERDDNPDETVDDPLELGRARWLGPSANCFSLSDPLRPVVITILRSVAAAQERGTCELRLAGYYVVALVSIHYGMAWKDVCDLGLEPLEGSPGHLRLGQNALVRRIGSGYFADDQCFGRSELALPLTPSLRWMCGEAGIDASRGGRLLDALPGELPECFGPWLGNILHRELPNVTLRSQSLHRTFDFVAAVRLKMPLPYVGILRARPLYGSRGESSYVYRTNAETGQDWERIQAELARMAGVPLELPPLVGVAENVIHGAPAVRLAQLVEELGRNVESAKTHNEITSCIWGVMCLLGARRAALHLNPAWLFRHLPVPSFSLCDKTVAGDPRGLRVIPLNAALHELVRACRKHFGEGPAMPYRERELWVCSLDLRSRPMYGISAVEGCQQPGRNAMVNELLREGVGSEIRGVLTGHDGQSGLPSLWSMVPGHILIDAAAAALHPILKRSGFDIVVERIVERLEELVSGECGAHNLEVSATRLDRFQCPPRDGREWLTPLTYEEDRIGSRLLGELAKIATEEAVPSSARCEMLLAFDAGIPTANFRLCHHYYSWRSLSRSRATGRYYFVAVGPQEDTGGLFPCPIELGNPEDSAALRALLKHMDTLPRAGEARANEGKLFSKEDHEAEVIRETRVLLPEIASLSDDEIARLLDRVTMANARHMHAGCVAGALAGRTPLGLNGYAVEDVIREWVGCAPDLEFLDGTLYFEWLGVDPDHNTSPSRAFVKTRARISQWRKDRKHVDRSNTADDLYEVVRQFHVSPSTARFEVIAGDLGMPENLARRHAATVYRRFQREGLLCTADSLRFMTAAEIETGLARATEMVFKPKGDVRPRPVLQADIRAAVGLLRAAGLRLGESIAVLSDGVRYHHATAIGYVPGGKTVNARRMFDIALLCPAADLRGELDIQLSGANGILLPKDGDRIQYLLAATFDNLVSPHDLRHYLIVEVLRFCRKDQLLRGNFQLVLDTVSKMVGHACGITSVNGYGGTMVVVVFEALLPLFARREKAMCSEHPTTDAMVRALRDDYSGISGQRQEIHRLQRFLRRACPFGERAAENTALDNGMPREQPLFECRIPSGPDAEIMATLLGEIIRLAAERNVDLRIGIDKKVCQHPTMKRILDTEGYTTCERASGSRTAVFRKSMCGGGSETKRRLSE